jgi:N-acetyl-gamma-glutamyl-phosphate reductase
MGYRVAVAGASGYAGGELLRLIAGHPDLGLGAAAAHGQAGRPIGSVHPHLRTYADLPFADTSPSVLAEADLVFLALPHGMSGALVPHLPEHVPVVDLGADHRPDPAWAYGLPELPGARAAIRSSRRVANTGCYAVAVILALAPLIAAGLAEPEDVVVVAASGTSGAGREAKAHLLGTEVMGDVSPYKVGAHQHVGEICRATGAQSLSMTPVLVPLPRGILATVTARPTKPLTASDVHDALAAAYADEPFVHVLPEGQQPHTAATLGSNAVHLGTAVDGSSGRIIVTSAIDNLGKGAAGQAVQNANLVLGLDETAGLTANGVAP